MIVIDLDETYEKLDRLESTLFMAGKKREASRVRWYIQELVNLHAECAYKNNPVNEYKVSAWLQLFKYCL